LAISTINPATEELLKTFSEHTDKQIQNIIENANNTFNEWSRTTFNERKILLLKTSDILKQNSRKYGEILTTEMGKTLTQAIAEVEKCAWVCEYYANNAESILSEEVIKTDGTESYVRFDPMGIILAVMPWNFPFWQVFRFAAPALMAGNVCLLKHASNVPQSAIAIEEIFKLAGIPEGGFTNLLISSTKVKLVIDNEFVKAATLTGSEFAGEQVAQACGAKLKKTVMELGGSDPFIVLEDANIKDAVNTAVTARLINNGQSCIAAKRFIVVEKVYEEFQKMFVEKMSAVKVGDPMDETTELGPIARKDLLIELEDQVARSVQAGAIILCGGKRINKKGFYFPATILSNVEKGMPAYHEEIFGPVASLIKAKDEHDAIRIANDSRFGLGAAIFTKDISKAKKLAALIESGSVFINGMVKSDPRLPFGGIKLSGYGRELSHYGIKEFVNIKSVWIK
jgi:succinate-semialdehyde dehydrogenase/glutarate-semialdehyde dehydrogenase